MPVYLYDTFTDADNTALTAHTMDVGPGWSVVQGTLKILSNAATPNSNNDGDGVIADAGASDFTITADLVGQGGSGATDSQPQIFLRYTDATHNWAVVLSTAFASGV